MSGDRAKLITIEPARAAADAATIVPDSAVIGVSASLPGTATESASGSTSAPTSVVQSQSGTEKQNESLHDASRSRTSSEVRPAPRVIHDPEEEREAMRLDRQSTGRTISISGTDIGGSRLSPSNSMSGVGVGGVGAGGIGIGNTTTSALAVPFDTRAGRSSFELEMDAPPPPRALPKKTLAVAVFLLLTGISCMIAGFVRLATGQNGSLALLIIGGIAFLPGAYQTYVIYKAWRGAPGFNFSMVPSFDE